MECVIVYIFLCFISGLSGDGDDEGDRKRFYEAIDQLALAFSSRSVSLCIFKLFLSKQVFGLDGLTKLDRLQDSLSMIFTCLLKMVIYGDI